MTLVYLRIWALVPPLIRDFSADHRTAAMAKLATLRCPHCGIRLNVRQSSLGSLIRCKSCGNRIHLAEGANPISSCAQGLLGCGGVILLLLVCSGYLARSTPKGPEPA